MSYERGNDFYAEGRYADAVREYSLALAGSDDPDLYENLAISLWQLGRWRAAARAFLRVLDGDLTRREQSLRLLTSCLFRDGCPQYGEELLRIYEQAFGPHPEQWKRVV